MVLPHLQFSSPLFVLLPKSFQANPFVQAAAHPALTQVQNVLGTPGGRPKAPFDYTNLWGECLTILLPFLLVWAWTGTRRQRMFAAGPRSSPSARCSYSLNRGAWIGVILAVIYLAIRLAARGRSALLGGICAAIALAVALILFTPLNSVVAGRLENGKSNNLRSHLSTLAITRRSGLADHRLRRHQAGTGQPRVHRRRAVGQVSGMRPARRSAAPAAALAAAGLRRLSSGRRCSWPSSASGSGNSAATEARTATRARIRLVSEASDSCHGTNGWRSPYARPPPGVTLEASARKSTRSGRYRPRSPLKSMTPRRCAMCQISSNAHGRPEVRPGLALGGLGLAGRRRAQSDSTPAPRGPGWKTERWKLQVEAEARSRLKKAIRKVGSER